MKEIVENFFEHLSKNRPKFWWKGIRRVKSGLSLNRDALNRGFTVIINTYIIRTFQKKSDFRLYVDHLREYSPEISQDDRLFDRLCQ
jgi:hypothetical protein